ncbi:hypothetical protein [Mesorhizobium sp. NZP2077]|uniref:hypothetical protein n=1 Tax=Mesorhizobium sp. NZP2077 TaxID=2483404 RepID=UPI0015532905|nr:hypothetical protein [Mesorhizobium sp. NZP2077]QKD13594.1 hypothetical protein HGP13_25600 [Mesorhizobium sp. NZP2077]
MKKLGFSLALVALAVSACDNKLPPTKAPAAEQSFHASNPAVSAVQSGDSWDVRHCRDALLKALEAELGVAQFVPSFRSLLPAPGR